MSAILTKPLIVPEYNNGKINLYTPDPATGTPVVNPAYTIDLKVVLNTLFPGQGRIAAPNCCKLHGLDLFVAQSSGNSQAVIKLPGYLTNPATAQAQAFIFTLNGNDYVGLAFDKAGNLYTAEGSFGNNTIVRYSGTGAPYPGAGAASGNNYGISTVIGNAGMTSYFGNLVFDAAGNLWAADYQNHRVVAFDAAGLGATNSYHTLANPGVALAVANTDPALNAPTTHLFAEPEGLDFDGFSSTANLWVANNNDGGGAGGVVNGLTSLVKLTKALQDAVLATANGGTVAAAAIVANANCFIYQVPNSAAGRPQFGGLQVDKADARLYVNEEVAGNGRAYDLNTLAATSANPANSQLAIISTNPGNGGIALLELGAFVADYATDQGYEPDMISPRCWESPSISLTQANGGVLATLPPAEDVKGGLPCVLYVQVQNFGATPTTGIEMLDLRWAKASAGLGWPKPWDGSEVDTTSPAAIKPATGGSIAALTPIPVIPAFGSVIVGPIDWAAAPDPSQYGAQDGHFCLLARIVTPGLGINGLSYPEGGNLAANVLNNARIAWRNIHIINPITNKISHRPVVLAANYSGAAMKVHLVFELLDAQGQIMRAPSGQVHITATGASLAALRRSSLGEKLHDNEPMPLPDVDVGIGNLILAPGETVAFTVDYVPVTPLDAYAVRVIQFAEKAGQETLIGGQTFVCGQVSGFPIKPPSKGKSKCWCWWWLLLLLVILLLLFYLL